MSFASLGLPEPIARGVRAEGYTEPTPVQRRVIPLVLPGHDVVAAAQTGSGKTAAFLLPILVRLLDGPRALRALVLVPTRELAAQVEACAKRYGRFTHVRTAAVYGGVPIGPQERLLRQEGVELLVATPGRLLDLQGRQSVSLDDIETLVLDEADRMVDMGFAPDLRRILRLLPADRQTLMFSATMPPELNRVASEALSNPRRLDLAPPSRPAPRIEQAFYPVPRHLKTRLLLAILAKLSRGTVIVFARTKRGADRLGRQLDAAGQRVAVLHGDRSQDQRERALRDFRNGRIGILVATDIASRGIDVDDVTHVINFDVPRAPEDYIHRIGRTGRMNACGDALTLVSPDEGQEATAIERFLGKQVRRVTFPGFDYARPSAASDGKRDSGSRRGAVGRGRAEGSRRRVPAEEGRLAIESRAGARRDGAVATATSSRGGTAAPPAHGRRPRLAVVGRRGRRRM